MFSYCVGSDSVCFWDFGVYLPVLDLSFLVVRLVLLLGVGLVRLTVVGLVVICLDMFSSEVFVVLIVF